MTRRETTRRLKDFQDWLGFINDYLDSTFYLTVTAFFIQCLTFRSTLPLHIIYYFFIYYLRVKGRVSRIPIYYYLRGWNPRWEGTGREKDDVDSSFLPIVITTWVSLPHIFHLICNHYHFFNLLIIFIIIWYLLVFFLSIYWFLLSLGLHYNKNTNKY